MKKKDFNHKLILKKSTISNLNHKEMGYIIGAHANDAKTVTDGQGIETINPTVIIHSEGGSCDTCKYS